MITEAKVRMHEAGKISVFQHLRWVDLLGIASISSGINLRTGLSST